MRPGKKKQFLQRSVSAVHTIGSLHLPLHAAHAGYFIVLAVFPTLVLLLSLLRYTPLHVETLTELLDGVLPAALQRRRCIYGGKVSNITCLFALDMILLVCVLKHLKNKMPTQKPTAAGTKANLPRPSDCSMAGISRLHTEAATITPAAKPVSIRWTRSPRLRRMKNTQQAPKVVPRNGMRIPKNVFMYFAPSRKSLCLESVFCDRAVSNLWLDETNHFLKKKQHLTTPSFYHVRGINATGKNGSFAVLPMSGPCAKIRLSLFRRRSS